MVWSNFADICITVTSWWLRWDLKSPDSWLFIQPIQEQIKENIKAPHLWPFVWEIHRWPANSLHKWPVTWKMFQFDDVTMDIQIKATKPLGIIELDKPRKHSLKQCMLSDDKLPLSASGETKHLLSNLWYKTPNPKTLMFLVLSSSCLCAVY